MPSADVEAPQFRALMGRNRVTVSYDGMDHAVIVIDERNKVLVRRRVMPHHELLEVTSGSLQWNGLELRPVDDDYGLAVAFAHFVNARSTSSVAESVLGDSMPGAPRWQYAVVNVGMFRSADRMTDVLAVAGASGWELVHVLDKGSNWMVGMEKGFMLLKRPVPDGHEPSSWCVTFSNLT